MTQVTVAETVYSVTVSGDTYTVTVADSQETINVQIASAAADTQVNSGGTGTSLIQSSTGGITTLKSVAGGDNVTLSDDGNGTITISATEDDLSNNTTDNLAEGTTNLYYTEQRVRDYLQGTHNADIFPDTAGSRSLGSASRDYAGVYADNVYADALTTVAGTGTITVKNSLIPETDNTIDLGSTTNKWRSLFLSGGSLFIDGQKVLGSDVSGDIDITTDDDQNLNISAGGSGTTGDITLFSAGSTTQINDNTINLGPALNTATVNVRGTLDVVNKIEMGDLDLTSGQIHQDSINGDLTLKTNGTGRIIADTSNLVVGTLEGSNTQITPTGITGTVSSIANHDTDALSEGSTNLYFTNARADARAQLKIDALVDSAPAALDTLNELAAALGDDANFSTTVTNSIATKLAISDFDSTFDTRLATKDTDDISEGSTNLYYTDARFNTAFSGKSTTDLSEGTNLYYTDARFDTRLATKDTGDLTEGSNLYYTDARARSAISLSSSNTNELSYDSATGVITYTSPSTVSASGQIVFDVRNTSGVDIARGDAVYISGHSGGKILVAKADANVASTMPAIGLANSAMSNNSDGSVLVAGEMTSIDTSAFSVGDVLYVSETAGELTATRPSAETTKIQNIGKVARSHANNGIIIVVGSGRANDVPNLDHLHVFIGDTTGYETRQLDTSDVLEDSSNLYYTDTRVANWFTNTGLGLLSTDVIAEGSTNLYHTDARAISAVEGATNLSLDSLVTIDGANSNNTKIGDQTIAGIYDISGIKVQADDTKWAGILLKEFVGGANKPAASGFTNPTFGTEIVGGTPSSPGIVNSGQRTFVLQSITANQSDGTLPTTAGAMIKFETNENQTTSAMGHKATIETIGNGDTSRTTSILANGNNITFAVEGDANIQSGGDLNLNDDVRISGTLNQQGAISNSTGDVTVDDNLKVNDNLTVDGTLTVNGNTTLGNDTSADVVTVDAKLKANGGLVLTNMDTATANYLAGLGAIDEGGIAYITDGDSGSKCIAVYDGSNWKRISFGANISSS